ncbi:hypothetical protein CEXT_173801 [Caerostris extrusa]|uniref:Uncharacterized protein n=1 Tax=Caerostris extrusa TaxID=172846 RepID=A0AAV4QF33_CAEEX|nr:hypothetical protein CEXT_173801 [Caerostris extrusa]
MLRPIPEGENYPLISSSWCQVGACDSIIKLPSSDVGVVGLTERGDAKYGSQGGGRVILGKCATHSQILLLHCEPDNVEKTESFPTGSSNVLDWLLYLGRGIVLILTASSEGSRGNV